MEFRAGHIRGMAVAQTAPKKRLHSPLLWASLLCVGTTTPFIGFPAAAQTENATLQGTVTDPEGAFIPEAQIIITNTATGITRTVSSNGNGEFAVVGLNPGTYSLHAEHAGFSAINVPQIVLSVGAREQLPLHMAIGGTSESVTVEGSQEQLLTTSAAVSTVVNQEEVANMPLNGRSFQDLMLMVPGVTTANPQTGEPTNENGVSILQVNGDSGYSNSFTVDGVSANFGSGNEGGFAGIAGSGGLAAATILGTTQALVPVDDLQEFRVETNSYAAEYGGYSGGQFVFVTRSGTNAFHGSASDYIRNTAFDANDYFNNFYGKPRQALHQNDFEGTFGGPVVIPRIYNGRMKTFFFANYEGLRANLPTAAYLQYVPTQQMKKTATGPLAAFLASFPSSNVPNSDLGDGLAEYVSGYAALNNLDSYNLRIDEVPSKNEALFVRASNTQSSATEYFLSQIEHLQQTTRTYTAGLTSSFGSHITNQFRANFSSNAGPQSGGPIVQGDASPFNLITAGGYPANISNIYIGIFYYPASGSLYQQAYRGVNETRQVDVPDNLTWILGKHQVKFGFDYRKLNSTLLPESPLVGYEYYSQASLTANTADYIYNESYAPFYPGIHNVSAYAEDQWQAMPRLTVSYGLRWDVDPAPTVRRGNQLSTLINQNNLSQLAVGAAGAPYNTYYYDVAPRLGVTYLAHSTPGYETQVRGGVGVFYDSAVNQGNAQLGYYSPGFSGYNSFCPYSYCNYNGTYSFPLPPQLTTTPIQYPPTPPFTSTFYALSPHLANPYSIQANVALQQDFGASNALTLNYVGSFYRKGIKYIDENINAINPNFQFVEFETNGLRSAYNAGQFVFQHRVNSGLFAYAGYTWAHDITQNQINAFTPYQKGNAGGDVRSNFNAVVTWNIPHKFPNHLAEGVLGHWGIDVRFMARTGFPINLQGAKTASAASDGQSVSPGVDFVPGQPIYLYSSGGRYITGGKQLNPAAFVAAPVGTNGNVPINYYRGFGMNQWNTAVRRDFEIYEQLHLQFRAEAFNVLNHPNFGGVDGTLSDVTFGQVTNSLAASLSPSGGTSSAYQSGGPRNLQLSLKLLF